MFYAFQKTNIDNTHRFLSSNVTLHLSLQPSVSHSFNIATPLLLQCYSYTHLMDHNHRQQNGQTLTNIGDKI